jgi:hypothetical protein
MAAGPEPKSGPRPFDFGPLFLPRLPQIFTRSYESMRWTPHVHSLPLCPAMKICASGWLHGLKIPGQLLIAASGVERIAAATGSNKRQRTADDGHVLHEVLKLIGIAKLRVPDES